MSRLVYLAGPEVFMPEARALGQAKKQICEQYGLDGLFPLDDARPLPADPAEAGHAIFAHCIAMMDRADAVIANLTPFRGASADVGTAVEIGYMRARDRPVFAYTNLAGDYIERVREDGMDREDFGFFDNLMCEGVVFASGNAVIRTAVESDALYTDLRGFERCVRQAADALS